MTETQQEQQVEKHNFDADIQQLMHLIVHTFYSNRDVFLRELVSNSSDALDKIRYDDLKNSITDSSYEININLDKESKMLKIQDTGVGMSKEDLLNNLGMIARSGTKNFMKALEAKQDLNLIGQFGVGFYSVFLVADKVVVRTKKNDETAWRWESTGDGSYFLYEDDKTERGTSIELYMKEDALDYLGESKIRDIIKQHSQYMMYPLNLLVSKTREVDVVESLDTATTLNTANDTTTDATLNTVNDNDATATDATATDATATDATATDATATANNDEDGETVNDIKEVLDEGGETSKKTITESYAEWEKLNDQEPIWIKNSDEVTLEEYNKFYKNLTNDYDDCLRYKHFTVEGQIDVKGVVFIPKKAPMDMFQNEPKKNKIKLYVKRVFISDTCEELIPDYMNFVSGIIDSNDLPLTVSREMLQQNRSIKLIKKSITKQVLNLLDDLSGSDDYETFYNEFSKNIKLGIHSDDVNRVKLTKLLRFNTSNSLDKQISLDTYVLNMKENQPGIYYITGENINIVQNSPFLEKLKNKGFDVLFMTDAIDEYVLQYLTEFDGKKLFSVTKVNLDTGDTENTKKELEELSKEFEPLCKKIKEVLKTDVEDVLISNRIVNTPCCLVTAEHGWSANMERIMKAQTLGNNQMAQFMKPKKTLELNPNNNMIKELNKLVGMGDQYSSILNYYIDILYNSSILDSGFSLQNPRTFSENIYRMMDGSIQNFSANPDEFLQNVKSEMNTGGTEESVGVTEESVGVTEESVGVTEESVGVTEESVGVTEESVGVTEESVGVTEESVGVTEETLEVTRE